MLRVIGVDTDSKGSIAVLDTTNKLVTIYYIPSERRKLKTSDKTRAHMLGRTLAKYCFEIFNDTQPINGIFVEEQWSRDGQSAPATFTFGCVYCAIMQALDSAAQLVRNDTPLTPIHSTVWKHALGLDSDKAKARALATKLFPKCASAWKLTSLHTSAAEALLLAFYGLVQMSPKGSVKANDFAGYDLIIGTPHKGRA
jgi:hypothetical protein